MKKEQEKKISDIENKVEILEKELEKETKESFIEEKTDSIETYSRKSLNVLLLGIPLSWVGGVVTAFNELASNLRRKGMRVAAITHGYSPNKNMSIRGVNVEKYGFSSGYNLIMRNKNETPFRKKYAWVDTNTIVNLTNDLLQRKFIPDIMHFHTHTYIDRYNGGISQILNSKLFQNKNKPPIVYTLHNVAGYTNIPRELRVKFEKLSRNELDYIIKKYVSKAQFEMMTISDRIITISESHKKAISILWPHFSEKIIVIQNALDMSSFLNDKYIESESKKLLFKITTNPKKEKIILYSGRVEGGKAVPILIKAFNSASYILEKKGIILKLVLVGGNKKYDKQKLIKWGIKSEYLDRVYYTGWISDRAKIAKYYRMLSVIEDKVNGIMIMPVFSKDLFGFSVKEAMTMKVPIITCESSEKLNFGVSCSPENYVKMIEFILTSNPKKIKEHIVYTYNTVRNKEEYSAEGFIKKHIDLYFSVVREKSINKESDKNIIFTKNNTQIKKEQKKPFISDSVIEKVHDIVKNVSKENDEYDKKELDKVFDKSIKYDKNKLDEAFDDVMKD